MTKQFVPLVRTEERAASVNGTTYVFSRSTTADGAVTTVKAQRVPNGGTLDQAETVHFWYSVKGS